MKKQYIVTVNWLSAVDGGRKDGGFALHLAAEYYCTMDLSYSADLEDRNPSWSIQLQLIKIDTPNKYYLSFLFDNYPDVIHINDKLPLYEGRKVVGYALITAVLASINDLITEIYAEFAKYILDKINGVYLQCRLKEASLKEFQRRPVALISAETIYDYFYTTAGSKDLNNDIRYLLPRMLELFNSGKNFKIDLERNFENFNLNLIELWQPQEIALIKKFAELHFKRIIFENNQLQYIPLDELVLMWHLAGLNVKFLLEIWERTTGQSKTIIDYTHLLYSFKNFKYDNFCAPNDFARDIVTWATSAKVIKAFQDNICTSIDDINNLSEEELFDYEFLLNYS